MSVITITTYLANKNVLQSSKNSKWATSIKWYFQIKEFFLKKYFTIKF